MEGAEKNGLWEPSIHQMSLMFLPKPEDSAASQVGKKNRVSLVGEFCKIPGSFLFKSTNKPVSNPLKHFPGVLFFFFSSCVKMKCHWTSIYKVCCALLTLQRSWPLSLPSNVFFLAVWNGTISKRKSSRWAAPLFLFPCLHSVQGFTHPRVQFGWQSWQTAFPSAYFQTRVSFSPRTPAGQDFTQWGPSIKWAHFMQLSGPCKESQLVYNALISTYSGRNSEDKSKCLPRLEVFIIIWFYYFVTCYSCSQLLLQDGLYKR